MIFGLPLPIQIAIKPGINVIIELVRMKKHLYVHDTTSTSDNYN